MLPACCRSRSVTLYLQRIAAMLTLRVVVTRSYAIARDQLKALPMSRPPIGWRLAWPPSLSRMLSEVILGMVSPWNAAAELPWRDVSR
jgi:hypothetical protein